MSPVERDVQRGVCCAFLERCAARGIRPVDVHRALEAYGKLVLDLRRLPDLQERESEHEGVRHPPSRPTNRSSAASYGGGSKLAKRSGDYARISTG